MVRFVGTPRARVAEAERPQHDAVPHDGNDERRGRCKLPPKRREPVPWRALIVVVNRLAQHRLARSGDTGHRAHGIVSAHTMRGNERTHFARKLTAAVCSADAGQLARADDVQQAEIGKPGYGGPQRSLDCGAAHRQPRSPQTCRRREIPSHLASQTVSAVTHREGAFVHRPLALRM